MEHTMVILRYSDGAVGLTGWGFTLVWIFVVIAIMSLVNRMMHK
jgi:hypothetical protein